MSLELVFDIETIPCQLPGFYEEILERHKQNGAKLPTGATKGSLGADLNLSEEEIKAKSKGELEALWLEQLAGASALLAAEDEYRKTSFDAAYGELAVIGWRLREENETFALYRMGPTVQDEQDLLQRFFDQLGEQLRGTGGNIQTPRLIGHNIEAFDLPFLFKRAVILGIKPPIDLSPRRYSDNLYDTMLKWAGYGNRISLDKLCKILDIPTPKNGIDGSKVWDYIKEGRIVEVADYCKDDVNATGAVYGKMIFELPAPELSEGDK